MTPDPVAALRDCVKWFDSKPVRDTFQQMAVLSASRHYLALDVDPEFSAWATDVWTHARAALTARPTADAAPPETAAGSHEEAGERTAETATRAGKHGAAEPAPANSPTPTREAVETALREVPPVCPSGDLMSHSSVAHGDDHEPDNCAEPVPDYPEMADAMLTLFAPRGK